MRNLEPNEYRSLVESYEAVYDQDLRNKLEEEKEIAEFYEFVNLLIDEGYDLSECTEEDLCEYYITETGKKEAIRSILRAIATHGGKGLRQAWNIPAGQSIHGTVGRRAVESGARAAGSVAKGVYEVPKSALKAVGGFIGNIAKKPIIAVPLTAAGLESFRGEKSLVRQAAQGKFPQVSIPTAKPEPEKEKRLFKENSSIRYIISEGPDWTSAKAPKGIAALTLGGETKVYIPQLKSWQFPATARKWAREQGYTDWDKIPNPPQPPRPARQGTQTQPSKTPAELRAELERDFPTTRREPSQTTTQPAASTSSTSSTPAASTASTAAATREPEPPKTSPQASTRPSTPSTPVKPPSVPSGQTGDRIADLNTWRQKFPQLAAKVTPFPAGERAGTQMGTGQSVMSKQADELRSMQKASQERQKAQTGPMYSSPDVKSKMSSRTNKILGVKESYDAFDLVLDYLFSQGHVDTLEEALYVMMEMNSETIQNIVEQQCASDKGDCPPMGEYDDEPTLNKLKAPPKPPKEEPKKEEKPQIHIAQNNYYKIVT